MLPKSENSEHNSENSAHNSGYSAKNSENSGIIANLHDTPYTLHPTP